MGPQDGLTPVAEASVISRFEELFQVRLFRGRQPDPPHRVLPLLLKTLREGTSKKRCKIIRRMY
jgi:hypothetical protein